VHFVALNQVAQLRFVQHAVGPRRRHGRVCSTTRAHTTIQVLWSMVSGLRSPGPSSVVCCLSSVVCRLLSVFCCPGLSLRSDLCSLERPRRSQAMLKFPDGFLWGTATAAYQ